MDHRRLRCPLSRPGVFFVAVDGGFFKKLRRNLFDMNNLCVSFLPPITFQFGRVSE